MLIEPIRIESFLDTQVRKLSSGPAHAGGDCCQLAASSQILFLDEPTIGLDVMARQELRDLISEWNQQEGITIFLTSHDAGDIESVARRVVVVNHGAWFWTIKCLRCDANI